jgi:DNA (cytosine-5)-methyltransferase 1
LTFFAVPLGVPWMTRWEDITEAIPPAYTEHIGRQLLAHVEAVAA